jgi:hypothetical protein
MLRKKGQSLIEYVILASVVIAIVVVFSGDFFGKLVGSNGAFTNHFNNMRGRMGVR